MHVTTYEQFLTTPFDDLMATRMASDPKNRMLALLRGMLRDVPAYQAFLRSHGVGALSLADWQDFQRLPLMTKANYLHVYPLPERCWGGRLELCDRIALSSGSTGTPTFWPRALHHEADIAVRFEQVLRGGFQAHQQRTLAVVCFALGNWVGGMYTASCCWHLAQKGYPLMVATPGNKLEEIFRVVSALSPHFDQTVLLGYPPFIKDVVDGGAAQGIEWARYGVKMIFAGEVFSEEWRALVTARVGGGKPCYTTAALYGTADGGVLGNETPTSIAIRRFLADTPAASRELFGEARLPTLVRYDPWSRYFELHDGTLVVSGDNGIPLLRYHIADQGGIVEPAAMERFLADWGADLTRYGLDVDAAEPALPFAYVFGRADFTVSYYGANIYPENVTTGLEQPEIVTWSTGKFVLEARDAADGGKDLYVTVELRPGVAGNDLHLRQAAESIQRALSRLNSEFANYVPVDKQLPRIQLRPHADPEYFPVGVKHRYSRR